MTKKLLFRVFSLAALAGLGGLVAPACRPSAAGFCSKVCECGGCSDDARAECVDSVGDSRKTAEEKGCSAEFEEYFSCANAEVSCNGSSVDFSGCETESESLFACAGPLAVGGNVCDLVTRKAYQKFEDCGIDISPPPDEKTDCPLALANQYLCFGACLDDATCGAIEGSDATASQKYSDCINGCP